MVIFRNMCIAENLLNRIKWSFKLHSDIARSSALFCSTKLEADLPSPPKRPPTAYMIFCKENRPDVMKENPDLRGTELIKLLAEKWTSLTPSLKKPYEETARESTIVYGKLHKEFYENLTEDQRDALYKQKVEKRESKKMQKLKKALKGSGMPRLPFNAYTIFVQMKAKASGVIKDGPTFIKQVAEEWNNLSVEEKKVFSDKAKEDKQRFESEMTRWRERLAEEGHTSLLKSYEEGKFRYRTLVSTADSAIASESSKKTVPVTENVLSSKRQTKN